MDRFAPPPAGRAVLLGAGIAFILAGCAATPVSRTGTLDERWAWRCDRLVVEWAMEAARLQEMTGPALTIREQDGAGRLRLEVMRCPPPASARNARTLSYAYVLIPVEGESSPISITGVSPGGWRFVRTVVAGDSTERLFSDFSHELTRAEQALVVREGGGDTSVSVRLEFAEGYLDITAELEPGAAPHRESTALLGSGPGYVSAYFGEEAFERCAASATVRSAGATPLPPLPARPAVAVFDRELASHRVYWRVPVGG